MASRRAALSGNALLIAIFLPERHYVTFGQLLSQSSLSSVCNVCAHYSKVLRRTRGTDSWRNSEELLGLPKISTPE